MDVVEMLGPFTDLSEAPFGPESPARVVGTIGYPEEEYEFDQALDAVYDALEDRPFDDPLDPGRAVEAAEELISGGVVWSYFQLDGEPADVDVDFKMSRGRLRQVCFGRWRGREAGKLGGRPRGTRGYTLDEERRVHELRRRGWGRGTIARATCLRESQVRYILERPRVELAGQ